MNRITEFDEELQRYRFIKDMSIEDVIDIVGELEDYKESHEISSFSEYIVSIRKRKGLTQEQFSQLLHETRSTLANYESNKCKPSKNFLFKMSRYADVPIEEIKTIYKRIQYGLDDEKSYQIFSDSYDKKQIAFEAGRHLKFEREFYDITKKDLALKISQRMDEQSGIKENKFSATAITKYETGVYALNWVFCGYLYQIFKDKYNVNSAGLRELSNRLKEITERGIQL